MSEETPSESRGLFDSLKGLAASLVGIVQTRLDLLSIELEENRERLLSLLVLMLVALFCLGVGVVLAAILIVVVFWDSNRLLVLGLLAGIFLAGGATAWGLVLYKIKTKPRLFAATLNELAKDRHHLVSRS
jgi:uncharacterized membrane protein YqjE